MLKTKYDKATFVGERRKGPTHGPSDAKNKDMKKIVCLLLLVLVMSSAARLDDNTRVQLSQTPWKLMVLSDVHLMAPSLLGKENAKLQKSLNANHKFLAESEEILDSISERVMAEKPQVLFITGDLTKDGEKESHGLLVHRYLEKWIKNGTKVYVIPGNHDINNPWASRFRNGKAYRTASVTPQEFATIYKDCGYGTALARDPYSLSYIAQLRPGLRLLALDGCRYEENTKNYCVTGGRLKPQTIAFIQNQVEKAHEAGCEVIAMIHHGVVAHFSMEKQLYGEFLIADNDYVSKVLQDLGVRVIFTGHFHANDVATDGTLSDVQTGSTVSYPHPYRIINVHGNIMDIRTARITTLTSLRRRGENLDNKSQTFVLDAINSMTGKHLPQTTSKSSRKAINSLLTEAAIMHLRGDEQSTTAWEEKEQRLIQALNHISSQLAAFVDQTAKSLTTDTPTPDNNLSLRF